VGTDTLELKIQ